MATVKKRPPKKELHYHGCIRCSLVYPDACKEPTVDYLCNTCRSGRPSVHQVGREAHACCPDGVRPANKDDIKVYLLRGSRPWWICRTCCRVFVRKPVWS